MKIEIGPNTSLLLLAISLMVLLAYAIHKDAEHKQWQRDHGTLYSK